MALHLREYQQDAHDRVWAAWERGTRCPAVVAATGAGKTHIIASLAERWHDEKTEHRRVLVLAHRGELLSQAAERIRRTGTRARVGVVKGNLNQVAADIVVASVQTMRNEDRRRLVRNVGLIIVDECHHATAQSYRDVLGHYGALPDLAGPAVAVGFTATMMRADGAQLGDVWTDVVHSIDVGYLIEHGFLVPPVPYRVRVADLDLAGVKKSHGDYQDADLGRALGESMAPAAVIRAYEKHAKGMQALLFTPTVDLATEMADLFRGAGYRADWLSGKTAQQQRSQTLKRYRERKIDILCNCGILTEGTDLPTTQCVILMRPTKSASLFIQIVGRGMRLDPDDPTKDSFVFLDVCGASQHHTLSASIELFGEPVKLKESKDDPEELVEVSGDEDDDEPPAVEASGADGPIESWLIDLLSPKRPSWRQTKAGAWYLPRRGRELLAIVPSATRGKLDVVILGANVGDSYEVSRAVGTLTEAMRIGDAQLDSYEKGHLANGAKWRSKPPTAAMVREAKAHGLSVSDGINAGQLSDRLTQAIASRRIDPCTERRMAAIKRYCGDA